MRSKVEVLNQIHCHPAHEMGVVSAHHFRLFKRMAGSAEADVLSALQRSAREGTLLESCQPEIKELMRQIDILLSRSQRECEDHLQAMRHQLELRERDLSLLRVTVKERTAEVECVKERYSSLQNDSRARNADCEAQLMRLRAELSRLKQNYERLKSKRGRAMEQVVSGSKEECQALRQELEVARGRAQQLERRCSEVEGGLQTKSERVTSLEVVLAQRDHSMKAMAETLRSKGQVISSLEEQLRLARSMQLSSYHSELAQAGVKLKTQQDVEKQLRDDLTRLKQRLATAEQDSSLWKSRYQSQSEEHSRDKTQLLQSHSREVEGLKGQLGEVRRDSSHQLREREVEIQRCRGQLSHSGSAIKLLEERVRQLEKQLGGSSKKSSSSDSIASRSSTTVTPSHSTTLTPSHSTTLTPSHSTILTSPSHNAPIEDFKSKVHQLTATSHEDNNDFSPLVQVAEQATTVSLKEGSSASPKECSSSSVGQALEAILNKHLQQLDSSIQTILAPPLQASET